MRDALAPAFTHERSETPMIDGVCDPLGDGFRLWLHDVAGVPVLDEREWLARVGAR